MEHLQRLPCVHRGSAASTEGLQRPQRVCSVHRGSAASTEGQQRFQRVCIVLERWWAAWSVGGQPGALVGGLVIMLEPQDCPGTSGSDQERLDPTRSVWIRPGAFGSDQERLDPTRSVWIRPGASGSTGTRSGRQVGG